MKEEPRVVHVITLIVGNAAVTMAMLMLAAAAAAAAAAGGALAQQGAPTPGARAAASATRPATARKQHEEHRRRLLNAQTRAECRAVMDAHLTLMAGDRRSRGADHRPPGQDDACAGFPR